MADHLLVVDDDPELRNVLRDYLGESDYRVSVAADGRQMWRELKRAHVDLIILDLMLARDDGLTLCRELRERSEVPVLILSARGEDTDRIVGLELGADDYLPKPFNPRELLARIRALIRRSRAPPAAPSSIRRYQLGDWQFNGIARQLVSPAGVVLPLGNAEFRLLQAFVEHPHQVLSREQLTELTKGRDTPTVDRGIDMQVSRLRQRFGGPRRGAVVIKTIRNEGYVLALDVEAMS